MNPKLPACAGAARAIWEQDPEEVVLIDGALGSAEKTAAIRDSDFPWPNSEFPAGLLHMVAEEECANQSYRNPSGASAARQILEQFGINSDAGVTAPYESAPQNRRALVAVAPL